jgi:hypothetical protein
MSAGIWADIDLGVERWGRLARECGARFLQALTGCRPGWRFSSPVQVGLVSDWRLSVGLATVLASALALVRVGLALIGNAQGAKSRRRLFRTPETTSLVRSWERRGRRRMGDRTGRLQELLTTFANQGAPLVSSFAAAISAGFSLLALLVMVVAVDPAASLVVILAVGPPSGATSAPCPCPPPGPENGFDQRSPAVRRHAKAELTRDREAAVVDQGQPIGRVGALTLRGVAFEYEPGAPVLRDVDGTVADNLRFLRDDVSEHVVAWAWRTPLS